MKYIKSYKLFEAEIFDMPIDITKGKSVIEKDPRLAEIEYEKVLGRKGELSEYFRATGKKFTFGVLKSIFKDAIEYKKKRELMKGGYKFLHRAIPLTISFFYFPVWIVANVLGASRAFDKIIVPLLNDPANNYNSFLVRMINGAIAISEGEIKHLMENDWFYDAFVMDDDLIQMVRKDVLRKFAVDLAKKMETENEDTPVPHHYVENELKLFLNSNYNIRPPMELKSTIPNRKK